MAEKRIEITNTLCRQVQLLIKGGATNKEAGELVGVSAATVSRIRTANYDPFKYQQNTEARRKGEEQQTEDAVTKYFMQKEERFGQPIVPPYIEERKPDQIPGQMAMFIPAGGGEPMPVVDENKLMRFLAGKIGEVTTKLDKLNDNLCQILRRMDNVK